MHNQFEAIKVVLNIALNVLVPLALNPKSSKPPSTPQKKSSEMRLESPKPELDL